MAFFPSPKDGECCEDPCAEMEDACDDCECPCKLLPTITQLYIGNYEIEYAGPKSTCEKYFHVCKSVTAYFPSDDLCTYKKKDGISPEFSPELDKWIFGSQLEQDDDDVGCTAYGIGPYYDSAGNTKKYGYFILNPEPVIEGGWMDNTGCDECETTIKLVCESVTDEAGFSGLPLCSDPSLEKPCNDGPYPKPDDGGTDPCCPSDQKVCGSGIQGSGFGGSGLTGSGCCKETNDCKKIPKCCERDDNGDKVLPDCPAEGKCCEGSGLPPCGSGVQGSGTQGSGCCKETDDCGDCCDDPEDCECDNCYDGEPLTKTFCVEEVNTVCDNDSITPPSSSC